MSRDHSVIFEIASSKYVIKKTAMHTKVLNVIKDFEKSNLETLLFLCATSF